MKKTHSGPSNFSCNIQHSSPPIDDFINVSQLAVINSLASGTFSPCWTDLNSSRSFYDLVNLNFTSFNLVTLTPFVSRTFFLKSLKSTRVKSVSFLIHGFPCLASTHSRLSLHIHDFQHQILGPLNRTATTTLHTLFWTFFSTYVPPVLISYQILTISQPLHFNPSVISEHCLVFPVKS